MALPAVMDQDPIQGHARLATDKSEIDATITMRQASSLASVRTLAGLMKKVTLLTPLTLLATRV
eukprot:2548605-Rhodomonas_salina.1